MGRLLLILLIVLTCFSLFFAPYISGLAYVFNSLLQPQYIWHWIFDGIPIFRITAGLAILGLFFSLAQKKTGLEIYKNKQSLMIVVIWVWMHLSHLLSPYKGAPASVPPEIVLSTVNSIIIMYFVMLPLFQNERALKFLCYIFIGVGTYYIYWANAAYFNQEWHRFINGRLVGPYQSPYADANVLSTLLVMSLPFLILQAQRVKSKFFKVTIILLVPFSWHAMILLGSRAALLASLVSLIPLAYVIRSKKVNIAIAFSFLAFLGYQGSLLIDRATETVDIAIQGTDEPLNPRLISWEAGLRLIPEYPVFGAGVQMFEAAANNHFPGKTPHVAHNTFINFSANTGILTGILFLILVYGAIKKIKLTSHPNFSIDETDAYAMASSSISIAGFFVCSIFLDLIIFEPFYIVLMINLLSSESFQLKNESSSM